MRILTLDEMTQVSGAGRQTHNCYCPAPMPSPPMAKKAKGNNGFGNGGSDGSNAGFQDATR